MLPNQGYDEDEIWRTITKCRQLLVWTLSEEENADLRPLMFPALATTPITQTDLDLKLPILMHLYHNVVMEVCDWIARSKEYPHLLIDKWTSFEAFATAVDVAIITARRGTSQSWSRHSSVAGSAPASRAGSVAGGEVSNRLSALNMSLRTVREDRSLERSNASDSASSSRRMSSSSQSTSGGSARRGSHRYTRLRRISQDAAPSGETSYSDQFATSKTSFTELPSTAKTNFTEPYTSRTVYTDLPSSKMSNATMDRTPPGTPSIAGSTTRDADKSAEEVTIPPGLRMQLFDDDGDGASFILKNPPKSIPNIRRIRAHTRSDPPVPATVPRPANASRNSPGSPVRPPTPGKMEWSATSELVSPVAQRRASVPLGSLLLGALSTESKDRTPSPLRPPAAPQRVTCPPVSLMSTLGNAATTRTGRPRSQSLNSLDSETNRRRSQSPPGKPSAPIGASSKQSESSPSSPDSSTNPIIPIIIENTSPKLHSGTLPPVDKSCIAFLVTPPSQPTTANSSSQPEPVAPGYESEEGGSGNVSSTSTGVVSAVSREGSTWKEEESDNAAGSGSPPLGPVKDKGKGRSTETIGDGAASNGSRSGSLGSNSSGTSHTKPHGPAYGRRRSSIHSGLRHFGSTSPKARNSSIDSPAKQQWGEPGSPTSPPPPPPPTALSSTFGGQLSYATPTGPGRVHEDGREGFDRHVRAFRSNSSLRNSGTHHWWHIGRRGDRASGQSED